MRTLRDFYKNKKVLITGHTGFKGSWLTIWLNQLGVQVIGIALEPKTDKDIFVLARLTSKITDYRQDIRDLEKVKEIFAKEQPEIVFHLAAQALVLPGYKEPVSTFETNIMGTVNILEACRQTESVRQVVIVTTDKVYENKEKLTGYKENDPLGGYDPYSASKAAAEIVTQSYHRSFFQSPNKSVATARAGNVIGGGDWSQHRLVPDFIKSIKKNKPLIIRNPDSVRPWQHVLEPLFGYIHLAMKMAQNPRKYSGAWNFGPEDNDFATVKELAQLLIHLYGAGSWEIDTTMEKPHETKVLRLDIDKTREILGWKPVLDFRQTVQWTVDWYKNFNDSDVYQLSANQIENYSHQWKLRNLP